MWDLVLQYKVGSGQVFSGCHTITHVISYLMIEQLNNMVTIAIYGNSL